MGKDNMPDEYGEIISIRLTKEDMAYLDLLCSKSCINKTSLLRTAISSFLEKNRKQLNEVMKLSTFTEEDEVFGGNFND